jgi:hypothetical protein
MSGWKEVWVYGIDVNGRECVVAKVSVPGHYNREQALLYLQNIEHFNGTRPYKDVSKIEGTFIEKGTQCPHCGK